MPKWNRINWKKLKLDLKAKLRMTLQFHIIRMEDWALKIIIYLAVMKLLVRKISDNQTKLYNIKQTKFHLMKTSNRERNKV